MAQPVAGANRRLRLWFRCRHSRWVGGGSGYYLEQERTQRPHARENHRKAPMKIDGSHLFWTVFAPEADERHFLAGLSVSMFLIIPMWGRGLLQFMGPNPVLASLVVGWIC